MRRKTRTFNPLISLGVLLGLLMLVAAVAYAWLWSPVGGEQQVEFTIASGQGLDNIGQDLVEAGLIRSIAAFKLQVLLSGTAKKIQAGDFTLSPNASLSQIVSALTRARTDRRVTLLEGWRREEIAWEIETRLSDANPDFRFDSDSFVAQTATLEGKLFPDTYFFPKNVTAERAIGIMITNFEIKTKDLTNSSGLSEAQVLVLASILEREARNEAERPVVAGILLNRFEINMALQADATVQYAKASLTCRQLNCDWWPRPLTRADLALDSLYNTYKYPGLPPAPISNPSLPSLKAAFQPVATVYFYYLHDGEGKIHYARTLEEHNQNVARFLR